MIKETYSPGIQLLLLLGISLMMQVFGQFVFGSFLVGASPEGLTEETLNDPWVFLSFALCMQIFLHLGSFLIFLRVTGIPFRVLIAIGPVSLKKLALIPLALIVCFLVIEGLHWLNQWLFETGGRFADIEAYLRDQQDIEKHLTHHEPLKLGFSLLALAVLPAIGEELIYRGILYSRLVLATGNIHFSAIISGIIFGALHFQPLQILPIAGMGILFAYIYAYTKNIWYTVLLHFLINGVQITGLYFWPAA